MSLIDNIEKTLEVIAEDTQSLLEIRNSLSSKIIKPARLTPQSTATMEKHEFQLLVQSLPDFRPGQNLSIFLTEVDNLITHLNSRLTPDLEYILNASIRSKIKDDAREYLAHCDASTWTTIRRALLQRYGDSRNEDILLSSLTQCVQLRTETYLQYHAKLLSSYNALMQNITLNIQDPTYLQFKRGEYSKLLVKTFLRGLLEPYRSYLGNFELSSLEECLNKCKTLDNRKQEWEYSEFLRKSQDPFPKKFEPPNFKASFSQNSNPKSEHPKFKPPQPFQPKPQFQPQIQQNPSLHRTPFPSQPFQPQRNFNPTPPQYLTNNQVFGTKPGSGFIKRSNPPEPMSIQSRINTPPFLRQNKTRPPFNANEIHNVEPEDEYIDPSDDSDNFISPPEDYPWEEDTEGNFQIPASSDPPI